MKMRRAALRRRLVGKGLRSEFLAAIVVGSDIAGEQLSPGDVGLRGPPWRRPAKIPATTTTAAKSAVTQKACAADDAPRTAHRRRRRQAP
jgi:hypothetical protein